jgi:hypothetical protein
MFSPFSVPVHLYLNFEDEYLLTKTDGTWEVRIHCREAFPLAPPSRPKLERFATSDKRVAIFLQRRCDKAALETFEAIARVARGRIHEVVVEHAFRVDNESFAEIVRILLDNQPTTNVELSLCVSHGPRIDFHWLPESIDARFVGDSPIVDEYRERRYDFFDNRFRLTALVTAGAADAPQETPVGRFLRHPTLFDPRILDLVSKFTLSS